MPHRIPTIRIRDVTLKRTDSKTGKPVKSLMLDFEYRGQRFRPRVGPKNSAMQVVARNAVVRIQALIAEGKFDYTPRTLDIQALLAKRLDEPEPEQPKEEVHVIPTFRDFAEEKYIPLHVVHLKSAQRVRRILDHLIAEFGDRRLDDITQLDLLAYQNKRLKLVTRSTTQRELAIAKNLFNKAISWLRDSEQRPLLSYNPVRDIKFQKEPQRTRYLTDAEAERLEAECDVWLRPLVIVLRGTGMRIGEALSLTWDDVNLKRGLAFLHDGETKNSEGRPVPISRRAREVLAKLPRGMHTKAVFLTPEGKPLRYERAYRSFVRARRRAEIKNIRPHDMRHDHGSRLAMGGVNERTIGEILGHKTPSMTRRYSHIARTYLTAAVEVLDDVHVEDDAAESEAFENHPDTQPDTRAASEEKG